jgi:hypothetical protein
MANLLADSRLGAIPNANVGSIYSGNMSKKKSRSGRYIAPRAQTVLRGALIAGAITLPLPTGLPPKIHGEPLDTGVVGYPAPLTTLEATGVSGGAASVQAVSAFAAGQSSAEAVVTHALWGWA